MPAGRQVKRPVGWSGRLKDRSAKWRLRTRASGGKNREAAARTLKRPRQWKCDAATRYAHQPLAEQIGCRRRLGAPSSGAAENLCRITPDRIEA